MAIHDLATGNNRRLTGAEQPAFGGKFSPDGEYITMWTDMNRPLDISIDSEGIFYTSERPTETGPAQMSVLDGDGKVLERFECISAHGSWVDAHGNLYLSLGAEKSVDKYVRVG